MKSNKAIWMNYFFSPQSLVSIVFIMVGFSELILAVFLIPGRFVLIPQGILFAIVIGVFNNFIILPANFNMFMPLPVRGKDIFASMFFMFAVFTFIVSLISVMLLIIANWFEPIPNFHYIVMMYVGILPIVFSFLIFLTSISIRGMRYYITGQIIYWVLFAIFIGLLSGWSGFRQLYFFENMELIFQNIMQYFSSSPQIFGVVISIVYVSCFVFSFISYKASCYNFRKMKYTPQFAYYGNRGMYRKNL